MEELGKSPGPGFNTIPHPIIIDNFLTEKECQMVWIEIHNREVQLLHQDSNIDYTNWRCQLDKYRTSQSDILSIFDHIWKRPDIMAALEKGNNYAYQMMLGADSDMTYIKIEGEGDICGWHKNDWCRFPTMLTFVNWIWYIDYNNNYTGGELDYSFSDIRQQCGGWSPQKGIREYKTIKNKHNRFVLFPSYIWHRVRPIQFKKYNGPMDGRMAINGHVGIKRAVNFKINSVMPDYIAIDKENNKIQCDHNCAHLPCQCGDLNCKKEGCINCGTLREREV